MLKFAALPLLVAAVAVAPVSATDEAVTADLSLENLASRDALTILRSMAGVRGLEEIDEHTVRITDSPSVVELARLVLDVAEHPSALSDDTLTREVGDGSVLTCVLLERASVPDVGKAIRKEVGVARLALNMELSTIMVRDTPDKVASALAIARRMEAAQK